MLYWEKGGEGMNIRTILLVLLFFVLLVYVTMDRVQAEANLRELLQQNEEERYYMVYSVPLDTDLTALSHYPSMEITKEDLE